MPRSRICSLVVMLAWNGDLNSGTSPQPPMPSAGTLLPVTVTDSRVVVCAPTDIAASKQAAATGVRWDR